MAIFLVERQNLVVHDSRQPLFLNARYDQGSMSLLNAPIEELLFIGARANGT
jgi:hypothetical protein